MLWLMMSFTRHDLKFAKHTQRSELPHDALGAGIGYMKEGRSTYLSVTIGKTWSPYAGSKSQITAGGCIRSIEHPSLSRLSRLESTVSSQERNIRKLQENFKTRPRLKGFVECRACANSIKTL